jgi:hypothetical protein
MALSERRICMSRLSIILFMVAIMAVSGIQIAHAESLNLLNNAGFEDDVLANNGGLTDYITDWSPGYYNAFNEWSFTPIGHVEAGVYNPYSSDITGGAIGPVNTAYVILSWYDQGVSQILADTLAKGMEYVLSVQVGNPSYNPIYSASYRLELLAGDDLLVASDNTRPPARGTWKPERHSISYNYNEDPRPLLLKKALKIRLLIVDDGSSGNEIYFDDVTLTATAVPSIANTPAEQDVTVDLGSDVTVTFDNVTASGNTTMTTSETPPEGSFFINFIPPFYEISTTAVFTGDVRIELSYDDDDLEPFYRLFHFGGSPLAAVDITDDTISPNPDTEVNKIIGVTNSFSTFAVGYTPNQPPIANAGSDHAVEQENYDGAEVTLDGSGSTDPDSTPDTNDDIVSFEWYEGDTFLGNGEIINYTFPLGEHIVTLMVTDSDGETDEDEIVITVQNAAPKNFKQIAIDALSELLPTGDNKTDKRIKKALKHLEKSLDPKLWETDSTLTKKGKKVFDEEKKAVKDLQKLIKDRKVPDDVKVVFENVIDELLTADKLLAETALNEAKEYEGTDKKVGKEIEKSEKELEKATKELEKGKPEKAIDHYKKAWEHAQHAMK